MTKLATAAAALALVSSVCAFAPSAFTGKSLAVRPAATASALKMADTEGFVGKPFGFGGPVFDPLGLSKDISDIELKRWRECEIKHGRVAMLATVGTLLQENWHPFFPEAFTATPSIYHFQMINNSVPGFWLPTLFIIGVLESRQIVVGWKPTNPLKDGYAEIKDDYFPGDLGFDPLGLSPKDDEEFLAMRLRELNNGRLAMIAIFGFWAQELVSNQGILEQLNNHGSIAPNQL